MAFSKILSVVVFVGAVFILTNICSAQQAQTVVLEQNDHKLSLELVFPAPTIYERVYEGKNYAHISAKGLSPILQANYPDLPKLVIPIQVATQAGVASLDVVEMEDSSFAITTMLPSKGNLKRSVDPTKLPYQFAAIYQQNIFWPEKNTALGNPYQIHNLVGQNLIVYPYQYNAISSKLHWIKKMRINITWDRTSTKVAADMPSEWDEFVSQRFINYQTANANKYTFVPDVGPMLILCPAKYLNTIQAFAEWKRRKGQQTFLVNIDTINGGVNSNSLKAIVDDYYNQYKIVFLQLIGDNTDIPPINENGANFNYGGPSDNAYGYIKGSDHYQELIVGRFSVANETELQRQVKKSLDYEMYPNTSTQWMRNLLAIGSNQGGIGDGDDDQADWEHERDIADSNVNYGTFLNKIELFDGDHGGADAPGNPMPNDVVNAINGGVGFVNYTGHGTYTGIVTSQFSNNNVAQLQNYNRYPMMLTVGCITGMFIDFTCFAEAMANAVDMSGNPTGTVCNAMSTIDQTWNPPMQAQDELNAYLRNARPNKTYTFGGMFVNGLASMNDQYNTVNTPSGGDEMTDTWVLFGDASQVVFLKHDGDLSCTHADSISLLSNAFTVNCNVDDATICLYQNGQILDVQKAVGGVAVFNFSPLTLSDTVFVTATKQNYKPYLGHVLMGDQIDTTGQNRLDVYPNPVLNELKIISTQKITAYRIVNSVGQILASEEGISKNIILKDMSTFGAGIYTLQLSQNGSLKSYKLIKR